MIYTFDFIFFTPARRLSGNMREKIAGSRSWYWAGESKGATPATVHRSYL